MLMTDNAIPSVQLSWLPGMSQLLGEAPGTQRRWRPGVSTHGFSFLPSRKSP